MSNEHTYRARRVRDRSQALSRERQSAPQARQTSSRCCLTVRSFLIAALAIGLVSASALRGRAAEEISWERRVEDLIREGRTLEATALAEAMALDPASAGAAHGWLGRVSVASARFEEAARHFGKARELGANIADIAGPFSRSLLKIGRREDACDVLSEASSATPRDGDMRYRAGSCLLGLGLPQQALPHIEAARRNGVSHSAAAMALARAQFGSGREDLAVELLATEAEESSAPGILLEIGKLLFRNVLYHQALVPLRKAWEAKPGWYDAGMYLALAHHQLEEYETCAGILKVLDQESRPAEFRYLLGSALGQMEQLQDARREFERGIGLAPKRADGYLNLGLFLLDQGQLDQAITVLELGAERDARGAKVFYRPDSRTNCRGLSPPSSHNSGDPARAQYFVELGDTLLSGQQWGAALAVYRAALSIDPEAARPYGGIALVCQELGTAEAGLEFAERGVELHPSDPVLHYYLGSIHEYLSVPSKAIASYQAALRLAGADAAAARYSVRLGIAQLAVGKVDEAENSYQAALKRDPRLAEGYLHLGKLRLRDGRYAEAESLLEQAVRLEPNLSEAAYSWGLALVRNGKADKGREILEIHRRKATLRQARSGGMQ